MDDDLLGKVLSDPLVKPKLDELASYHPDTHEHSIRATAKSIQLAEKLKLNEDLTEKIAKATAVHDVGKLSVPLEILDKQGELTKYEKFRIDRHAAYAVLHLDGSPVSSIKRIAVNHHVYSKPPRFYDNLMEIWRKFTMHPDLITAIQIVTVSDMKDALSSDRSYRKALPPQKVEEILRRQFKGDPKYVDLILNLDNIHSKSIHFISGPSIPKRNNDGFETQRSYFAPQSRHRMEMRKYN